MNTTKKKKINKKIIKELHNTCKCIWRSLNLKKLSQLDVPCMPKEDEQPKSQNNPHISPSHHLNMCTCKKSSNTEISC